MNSNPGPGHYQPKLDAVKAQAPAAKIACDQIDMLVQKLNKNIAKQARLSLLTPVLQKNKEKENSEKVQPTLSLTTKSSSTKYAMNEQGSQPPQPQQQLDQR